MNIYSQSGMASGLDTSQAVEDALKRLRAEQVLEFLAWLDKHFAVGCL